MENCGIYKTSTLRHCEEEELAEKIQVDLQVDEEDEGEVLEPYFVPGT